MMENNFSNEPNEDETLPAGQLVIFSALPTLIFSLLFLSPLLLPIIFDQMIKDHQAVFPGDILNTAEANF